MKEVIFRDLGLVAYQEAWDEQDRLFRQVIEEKISARAEGISPGTKNHLLFCEHSPVVTIGKSGKGQHLLAGEDFLKQKGIDFYRVNRGGDITYHGPGQVVGYPILNLDMFFTDIHKYLRLLEEMVIRTLAAYGLRSGRIPGATGVWMEADSPKRARKICAMGIRCSRWVTMHGFALNVNTDLSPFTYMVPCGISDKQVTSLQKELGTKTDMTVVKEKLKQQFSELFDVKLTADSGRHPEMSGH